MSKATARGVGRGLGEHALLVLEFEAVRALAARYATGDLGRRAAAQLYPSTQEQWIAQRQAETTQMRALLDKQVRVPLAGLHDVTAFLERARGGQTLEPGQLLAVGETLAATHALREFFEKLEEGAALKRLAAQLGDFEGLTNDIARCIENEERVADAASVKLAEVRRSIAGLEEQIHARLKSILRAPELQQALENDNLLMRNHRPVVAVKKNYRSWVAGIVLDRSNSGATLFIEPAALVDLSNDLEEAIAEERQEVNRILWELTQAVVQQREAIEQALRVLGWIDLTYAKARLSIVQRMTEPALTRDGELVLRGARHPLLVDMMARRRGESEPRAGFEAVVPIDVRLGGKYDLLLLTGPNTGGKTVTLKTIGVAVLMAQAGMHVPAGTGSSLPVFQRVYADIGDEQSLEHSLSTFSAHMSQVVKMLNEATRQSLVLIDELGAGTDPTEGAALGAAILEHLAERQAKVVVTTHLGSLKRFALEHDRTENGCVEFDPATLRPTYRLRIGEPGNSNALAIARRLGMPRKLLARAESELGDEHLQEGRTLSQAQAIRTAAEQEQQAVAAERQAAENLREKAAQTLAEVQQRREQAEQEADYEIDRTMAGIRRQASALARAGAQAPKPWRELCEETAARLQELAAATPLAQRRADFARGVRPGDYVYLRKFRRSAVVLRVQKNRQVVTVALDSREVEVGFDQVCEPPD